MGFAQNGFKQKKMTYPKKNKKHKAHLLPTYNIIIDSKNNTFQVSKQLSWLFVLPFHLIVLHLNIVR